MGRRRRRCRRRRHLELQVNILAGELDLEFVPMELGLGGSSGRFETEVLHRTLIPFIWGSHLGPGEPFLKKKHIHKFQICLFQQNACPRKKKQEC